MPSRKDSKEDHLHGTLPCGVEILALELMSLVTPNVCVMLQPFVILRGNINDDASANTNR